MAEATWREVVASGYDQVAEEYARLEGAEDWPRLRWLEEVLQRLPDGSRVLDLGCGNGLPATARIAQRHRVTGVDVSARQVAAAAANVPGAELAVADALALRYPNEFFDAVVSFYTLDHLPRERLPELLGRIHGWLRDGGLLLFSVEPDDNPGVVGAWLGTPMFFSSYDAGTTRELVEAAGFTILHYAVEQQLEGDRPVDWLWLLAQRRARAGESSDGRRDHDGGHRRDRAGDALDRDL